MTSNLENAQELVLEARNSWAQMHEAAKAARVHVRESLRQAEAAEKLVDQLFAHLCRLADELELQAADELVSEVFEGKTA